MSKNYFQWFALAAGLLFAPISAWATPPGNITLAYDSDKALLHVQAQHPSTQLEKNYLRKMVLTVNGQELQTFYYTRQKEAWGFTTDVDLTAKPGDVVKVELYGSRGGTNTQELTVPSSANQRAP